MKKKKYLFTTVFLFFIAILYVGINSYRNSEYNLVKQDFLEKEFSYFLKFEPDERQNIEDILNQNIVEDEEYMGFSNYESNFDFYTLYSYIQLAKLLNTDTSIANKDSIISSLNKIDISNYNLLYSLYYVEICQEYGIVYNKEKIMQNLDKFYDEDNKLFFLNSKNDFLGDKILISTMAVTALENDFDLDKYHIKEGIYELYINYNFLMPNSGDTLYNSGGDILVGMEELSMSNKINFQALKTWYESWKEYYSNFIIENIMGAVIYSNFLNVAKLFEPHFSSDKLLNYYKTLKVSDVEEVNDDLLIRDLIKNVDFYSNPNVINSIKNKIETESRNIVFEYKNIDIAATFYGVMLADSINYDINKDKLNHVINHYYELIKTESDIEKKSNYLYYTILIQQIVNDFNVNYDDQLIQSTIDSLLSKLEYKDNYNTDIKITREMLEIIANHKIFNDHVILKRKFVSKIEKALNSHKNRSDDSASVFTDEYIISKLMNLNIFNDEQLINRDIELTKNNVIVINNKEDIGPDIYSTFAFIKCYNVSSNFDRLEIKKNYVQSLCIKPGIYLNYETGYADLRSIYYGNIIEKVNIGGGNK